MHEKSNLFAVGGLIGATLVSGAVLVAPRVSADTDTTATATVTVSSTCSITGTAVTTNANSAGTSDGGIHTATVVNGSYTSQIGQTKLNTHCNDPSGYAIYAVGFGGNEKGGTISTKLHSSALGNSYDIVTGTAQNGDTSNWAMKVFTESTESYKPDIVNGYGSYSAVPANYAKVAEYSSAATATVGSSLYTTYAAYIAPNQPAGTYTGQVKYVLVHPSSSAPGTTEGGYTMQNVASWKGTLVTGESVRAVDARDGKAYWVTKLADGNIWMTQNLDLELGGNDTNGNPIVFTSENTDLNTSTVNADGTGATLAGYSLDSSTGVITWTPVASATTAATITNFASGNPANSVTGWSNEYYIPYYAEGGSNYMVKGANKTASECASMTGMSESICAHYHIGNYYNFTAAVALNNSASSVSSDFIADKYVMNNSICPKGWRLPNGLTDNNGTTVMSDYNALFKAYNLTGTGGNPAGVDLAGSTNVGWVNNTFPVNIVEGDPLYFARSGLVSGTVLYSFTGYGYYWSSTVNSQNNAYSLYYYSGVLFPAYRGNRNYGRSVRCVAR